MTLAEFEHWLAVCDGRSQFHARGNHDAAHRCESLCHFQPARPMVIHTSAIPNRDHGPEATAASVHEHPPGADLYV
jgi:hypothetical protein